MNTFIDAHSSVSPSLYVPENCKEWRPVNQT